MSTAPPPPPKAPAKPAPAKASTVTKREGAISSGVVTRPLKVVIYGPGGIGKTELAANAKSCGLKPLFIDLERGSSFQDVDRDDTIQTWDELRGLLHNDEQLSEFDTIVIDSLTKAEELAASWAIANIKHEKGHFVTSIEGYGFGKGYSHIYDVFLQLLGDLDSLLRRNKNIICISHDCVAKVPNPNGDNWIRYEPRLQNPESGKASIRLRTKEWSDHMLFIGYDVLIGEDGKAKGSGTRAIYPTEMPTHMAKSRSLSEPIVYEQGSALLWELLLNRKDK